MDKSDRVDCEEKIKMNENRSKVRGILRNRRFWNIIIFAVLGVMYFRYLNSAIEKLPLMDYWNENKGGGGPFLERVMTEPLRLKDIFSFQHALHWTMLGRITSYFFIRVFKCDNRAYIYAGMLITFFTIALLLKAYSVQCDTKYIWVYALGALVCTAPIVNLNQWEIMTLYCNFTFSLRIITFLLMFYIMDRYTHRRQEKGSLTQAILYGLIGFVAIPLIGSAYFPGCVAAVFAIMALDILINSKKETRKKRAVRYCIIMAGYVLATIVYLATLVPGADDVAADTSRQLITKILDYGKGFLVMLGSILLPQDQQMPNLENAYFLGVMTLIIAVIAVVLYFKEKMYEISYFPIACLVYAFVSIVLISAGRLGKGIDSLTSSRYVVETTIALIGILQIYWRYITNVSREKRKRVMCALPVLGIFCLSVWCDKVEMDMGKYRKEYGRKMIEAAMNIDEVSDEELTTLFQAPGEDVREGIAVMKKYHLALWSDKQ